MENIVFVCDFAYSTKENPEIKKKKKKKMKSEEKKTHSFLTSPVFVLDFMC